MTSGDDLAFASIAELAPRLRSREISPLELTRVCLDRIQRFDAHLNSFLTVVGEAAMAEAQTAEREIADGHYRGPLHGIPIAHKDLYYTQGVLTTAGSRVFEDFVPDHDAATVASLRDAGTILLGKLNMHELAAGGTSDNPWFGPVQNPWRAGHHPGGSSGGSGAALAAGLCYGATGSDTAGSIRIPSHCCGTSGIKPTYGRVSCFGVIPLSWSLDHAGPMARSAHDCALLLNAMAGYDRRDSASVDRPPENFTAQLGQGVRGLRVGVPSTYFCDGLQPEVEQAWRAAMDILVGLGAERVDVTFSQLDDSVVIGPTISRAETATYHHDWFAERPEAYSPPMHARFAVAEKLSAVDFVRAQRARERVRADLWSAFDRVDVLLTPTQPMTATTIEAERAATGDPARAAFTAMTRFTYPFNLSGFPAMSIPCGFDALGLPIGLQVAGPPWQEARVLRVGDAYQQATDWHRRRPPLPE